MNLLSRLVTPGGLAPFFYTLRARGASRFLAGKRFLILDRDTKFSRRFREALPSGTQVIWTPFQAPNANAHAERFIQSIKSECLDRMIWFGEQPLRKALFEYAAHYHTERSHQGLGNELIESRAVICRGRVFRAGRLGGLLNDYSRAA